MIIRKAWFICQNIRVRTPVIQSQISRTRCLRLKSTTTSRSRTPNRLVARHRSLPNAKSTTIAIEETQPDGPDLRSPLERFRQAPKKALSVTDIISPAWCELQYFYTLSKYGRKKATPAMKQGTKVHQKLETEVHEVVPVDVQTVEDRWGLRIWNVIQGLRTLRATGMTRELELWGVIDGQVINGVIDEVSYTCPDLELEASLEKSTVEMSNQKKITEMFPAQGAGGSAWLSQPHPVNKIYLTDVKTRVGRSLPKGPSLRPMQMQLMLYHRLLGELAANTVAADVLFNRYNLDAKTPFSDSFIAAISDLEGGFISESDDSVPLSISELSQHNTLNQLWSLMITELQLTIPTTDAIGRVLQAEFRSQKDGSVLGNTTFAYDDTVHRTFVEDEMKWWKGEREAKGVDIEEAFKCGICEFAKGCEWRIKKLEESTAKFRERRRASGKVDTALKT
ncbi:hypothetical protein EJ08DRAFT_619825 [Tothia fuscella]|uniref:Exonuclease V n=1 Tax=Tothia fuscella TaxID=1048955 RepID=A0A9P4NI02_9PEZI|nr:hypothetical protein EJ08DRAFT_619825 [Tothia fuscella]